MAEGVVTFLVKKLSLLLTNEAKNISGVEEQTRSLHDELEWINSFLRDADEKRRRYRRVDVWVSQIRNLAYDAEDVIDLFMLEVERQRQSNIGLRFMCYPKHLFTLRQLGNQIEVITGRIEKIAANKSKYGIENLEAAGETSAARLHDGLTWRLRRASMEEEPDVVGIEKDTKKLTMLLTQEESQPLRVVSIVGMGGLGKTTLAKSVYNSSDVKKSFDCYAWVYVSQEYRMKDLLFGVITQVMMPTDEKKEELKMKNEQELEKMLSDYLKERRSLLVFDDVWKKEDWDRIKVVFLYQLGEGKQRRRVLLTTRNVHVAEHADPSTKPHELRPLGVQESFDLFSRKVFQYQVASVERSCPEGLKDLGMQLVGKCGGLPLAIVVLGGLLSTKEKTPSVWSKVVESVKWQLTQSPQQCMEILALSYTDLPYYLQSCFLYFGLFPEDYGIYYVKLIRLWVAEGFIQQRGDETMEDVAEEYLEELVQRSMIQATTTRGSDGSVEKCRIRIHDLLRDLAISEAKKDKLLEIYGSNYSNSLNRFRRLAIHHPNVGMHHISSSTPQHLHSLLCFSRDLHKKQLKGFSLLRVLDLQGVSNLNSLPKEIGGLFLLKYLNLSGTGVRRIPSSMGNLCNLQTLDLSWTKITHIPKEIWKMERLRHIDCSYTTNYPGFVDEVVNKIGRSCCGPPRIDNLRDLQTVRLPVGSWIEGGLDKLTDLRELEIRPGGDLTLHTKAFTDSIVKLKKLRKLHIQLSSWSPCSNNQAPLPLVSFSQHVHLYNMELFGCLEKIPELEDFPPYLTELRLYDSCLKQDDQRMAILEKLPNLKILTLGISSFVGKEMICSAGGFAKLQDLTLSLLNYLEDLKVEQGAFPCLKFLSIFGCHELKMLPDGLRHVTTLQELNISLMPGEFKARVQKDTGEDWEKIKHIPSVTFTIYSMED